MNPILDMLMNSGNGGAVQQLSSQFGLTPDQTRGALGQLVPALASGVQRNAAQPSGLESLIGALTGGNHQRYLDDPSTLGQATQEGNSILGHLLGSKDASRAVANQASQQTGIGADVLKKMLPVVAAMVMAGLSKKQASGQLQGSGGLLGMFDRDGDGSVLDDAAGMLGGMFGRK